MKKYFGKAPNNIVLSNFVLGKPQTSLFEKNFTLKLLLRTTETPYKQEFSLF